MESASAGRSSLTRRDLWVIRAYYFFLVGGGGFVSPFLNLFFTRQNMDGFQIGVIVAVGSVIGLVAAPAWTRWSALSKRPLRLLQISLVLTAVVTVALSQQRVFLWLMIFFTIRVLVGAGASPLSDAMALRVTRLLDAGYGSIRVWGSFGWAIIVLGAGWLNEHVSIEAGFFGFGLAMVVGALLLARLRPEAVTPSPGAGAVRTRPGFIEVARRMLKDRSLVLLGVMLAIIGLGGIGVGQFENVYLSQLGATDSLIGVASMVGSVVEIPSMLFADRMVRRHRPGAILLLALAMHAFLRLLIFFFPSVFLIIAVKALWGVAFSFYTVALIKFIGERTHSHETATALAIFTVTLPSIIQITGTPLAGYAFDLLGAHWLYLASVMGYALGVIIMQAARSQPTAGEVFETR
jgi:PPP family 3-phenylpropionic acid transporter